MLLPHGLIALILALAPGCTTSYWKDRGRDAADMVTASVGKGAAAQVRVGPLPLGALACSDVAGLRYGGAAINSLDEETPGSFDNRMPLVLVVAASIVASPFTLMGGAIFVEDACVLARDNWDAFDRPALSDLQKRRGKDRKDAASASFWRVEVCAGLGITARLGVNIAEILDFTLGFTGLDMMRDDAGDPGT